MDIHEFCARPYQLGDEERIVDLLQMGFNRWPYFDIPCSPLEHWRWRYVDNPFKRNLVFVVEYDDVIVAVGHAYFTNVKVGDEMQLCSYGGDTVVLPAFRGKGLTSRIKDAEVEVSSSEVRTVYLTTTNPQVLKIMEKWGRPRFPFPVVDLVKIDDVGLHLRMNPRDDAWLLKLGYKAASIMSKIKSRVSTHHERKQVFMISKVDKFDPRITDFWEEVSDHYNFIIDRSLDFLNWRFCDPRAGNYTVLQAEEDGRILGYAVLRVNRQNPEYPIGHVADLLCLPDRLDVAEGLVKAAAEFFDVSGVNIVSCKFVRGHPYEGLVRGNGFVDSRRETYIFYYPYGEDRILSISDSPLDKIHFTYSDM